MIVKKIFCDYCKKQIIGDYAKILPKLYDKSGDCIGELNCKEQHEKDYHPNCIMKILAVVNGCTEKNEVNDTQDEPKTKEESPKQGKKETGKKNKLDIGKIFALKKAGWSYEKIADEMGTTKASIASTIYAYKKKMQKGCE